MAFAKPHAMMVDETHDEHARMGFVSSYKSYLTNDVSGGSRLVYDALVRPVARRQRGGEPDRHEIRRLMADQPFFQMVSSLRRTSQEMIWDSTGECVERQIGDLITRARTIEARPAKGSLRLDPVLKAPRYLTAVDIHCMPGNYHSEIAADDVFAGALYDRGVHLYRMKQRTTLNDGNGRFLAGFVKERFPALKPERVLDMGCGIGNATLAYAEAWPAARIDAIDVGAAMLRYGHARAEAIGRAVHFSQQNAEHTDLPGGQYDLVVSFLLMHETSHRAIHNIFRESHRLLAPGGVMIHVDSRQYEHLSPWDQFEPDWDTHYNHEPFMGTLHDMDLVAAAADAGFARADIFEEHPRHPGMAPVIVGRYHSNDGNVNGDLLAFTAVRRRR